jgi:hypothetical protein
VVQPTWSHSSGCFPLMASLYSLCCSPAAFRQALYAASSTTCRWY